MGVVVVGAEAQGSCNTVVSPTSSTHTGARSFGWCTCSHTCRCRFRSNVRQPAWRLIRYASTDVQFWLLEMMLPQIATVLKRCV